MAGVLAGIIQVVFGCKEDDEFIFSIALLLKIMHCRLWIFNFSLCDMLLICWIS